MDILLAVLYIVIFAALIFFGPLQDFLHRMKSDLEHRQRSRETKDGTPGETIDPEKMGLLLSIGFMVLALAFFLWKILTTRFAAF